MPRYSIRAWSKLPALQPQGREGTMNTEKTNKVNMNEHKRMHANVHDDGRLGCKRSFRSSQRFIRGGPTSVRPFVRPTDRDRPTDRPRVPELLQRCQPASQPSWSPPLILSSLLSLLVCFAEGCQAIENVILPTQLDRRLHTTTYIQFMDYAACLPSSLDNKRQRRLSTETNAPRGTGR